MTTINETTRTRFAYTRSGKPIKPEPKKAYKPFTKPELGAAWDKSLDEKIATAKLKIEEFTKRLNGNDPCSALEWSRREFEIAAELKVLTMLRQTIKEQGGWDALPKFCEYLLQTVLRNARSVESSTSMTSNLMERYYLAAMAKFLDDGWFNTKSWSECVNNADEAELAQAIQQGKLDVEYARIMRDYAAELAEWKAGGPA